MLAGAELTAAVAAAPPRPLSGTFARRVPLAALLGMKGPVGPGVALHIVSPRFLLTPSSPYRYNPANVAALYLGEGEEVAAAETKQHPGLGGFALTATAPDTVFHVDVKLATVLDLTEPALRTALGTDLDELTAPWRLKSPHAPTQMLGSAAYEGKRFEAIRFPSAPLQALGQTGTNIVIFRDALRPTSSVKLYDPTGTWQEAWP